LEAINANPQNKDPKNPVVAIVLLNWNGLELTLECLESLGKCSWEPLRIILVDNGSEIKPGDIIRKRFPGIKVIENEKNLGFAEGNNIGIRAALESDADYIMLLNNDTTVNPDFLEPLVEELRNNPETGAASPLILFAEPPDAIWFAGSTPLLLGIHAKRPWFRKNLLVFPRKKPYDTDALSGCALLISRDTINRVGLFDAVYFTYCEDTDYSKRLKKAGLKMKIVPASRIWHKVSASSGGNNNPLSLYLMGRGRVIFLCRHAPWYVWFLFIPFALGQLAMDFKRGGLTSGCRGVLARFKGYIDGFRGVLRIPVIKE